MNVRRWMIGVFASLCAVGCHSSEKSGEAAPSASESAATAASAALSAFAKSQRQHHGSRGGGLTSLIFNVAHDLPDLTDDQNTKIDTAEEEMPDHDPGPREAAKTFGTDLAAQIRAGSIDATKLQPDEAAMDAALNAMLDKEAKALTDLHDALTPAQRTTVATNLHTSIAAAPGPTSERDAGAPADRVARQVDRMSADLALDDGQKKQITTVLLKNEKAKTPSLPGDKRKDLDQVLTAFQGETLDAKQVLSQAMFGGKPPHEGMDEQIKLTAALVPILHPDQREKLASAADRPPMPMGGRPGGPGMGGMMRGPGMRGVPVPGQHP